METGTNMQYSVKILLLFVLVFSPLIAQEDEPKPLTKEEIKEKWEKLAEKTRIDVIGDNKDSLKKIPGSATVVSKKFLDETQPVDAMEVLRSQRFRLDSFWTVYHWWCD